MKSALGRAGSMSKLHGPRSINRTDGSPQKQTPKTVTFDKTDEVIHYDVMTPELTEEYWDQVSLQSCDSDIGDRGDRGDHDGRPLPAIPRFILPATLLRKEATSPLQMRRSHIGSPIADDDDFDFNLERTQQVSTVPEVNSPELPEPLPSPQLPEAQLGAPSMSTRIDAMLASGSGMSPSLRGSSGHRRTDSQMSELSEASAPYLPLRSPQRRKPEDEDVDPAQWRDVHAATVARQDSLQDNQRRPPTLKVSADELPAPIDLDRTYSKRRRELATMLDPRTSSTAHSVGTIAEEEAEEPEFVQAEQVGRPEQPSVQPEQSLHDEEKDVEPASATPERLPPRIHETTPLLSDDSAFIASQPSIPQSSSEVIQTDFDFGNDSFWRGGFLRNMHDDSKIENSQLQDEVSKASDDTANATFGISNEPAAQFAAGISPVLPEYTEDDSIVTQEHIHSHNHALPPAPQEDQLGEEDQPVQHDEIVPADQFSDEDEDDGGAHMVREHSYLNIKDLGTDDVESIPSLAPVQSDNDFFSLPPSPERGVAAADFGIYSEDTETVHDQSTPQKPVMQNERVPDALLVQIDGESHDGVHESVVAMRHTVTEATETSVVPHDTVTASDQSDQSDGSVAVTPKKAETAPPRIQVLPWDPSPSHPQLHTTETERSSAPRISTETPRKQTLAAPVPMPRVRVLPWDPSVENFQTSPIPVPDRSPKRPLSPQKGLPLRPATGTAAVTSTGSPPTKSPPLTQEVPDYAQTGMLADTDTESLVDPELKSLMVSMHIQDSETQQGRKPGSTLDSTGESGIPALSAEESRDTFAHNDGHLDDKPDPSNVQDVDKPEPSEELEKPIMLSNTPTLSPVAFSPFMTSLPSSPVASAVKEPIAVAPAAGIDELVTPAQSEQVAQEPVSSPPRAPSGFSPNVTAKSQDQHSSDISIADGQPYLDSDLSDFEASPVLQNEPSVSTLLQPEMGEQSAWESMSEMSQSGAPSLASTQEQQTRPVSIAPDLLDPITSPSLQNSIASSPRQPGYSARTSITEDVSLREPSFGESMSSTLQHMLTERSETGTDAIERSYTLREYGSYVVATSPTRRQRRSQAYEVIRDDTGSSYSTQFAIPRNRPLPSHSSLGEGQLGRGPEVATSQENVRAPSIISRTDLSSYSLATNQSSLQPQHFSSTRGSIASRLASETKLGPISEPENGLAGTSSVEAYMGGPILSKAPMPYEAPALQGAFKPEFVPETTPITAKVAESSHSASHKLQPIIEPSLTESEGSMIAASSSKTGNAIRMLDHSIVNEASSGFRDDTNTKPADVISSRAPVANSRQYQPTIFPNGVLFLDVKSINILKQVPHDTLVTVTLDNGVHCVTSATRKLSDVHDFAEEYRIGILDAPLSVILRLTSPSGPIKAPELELGADGSFAKFQVEHLRKDVFGKRHDLTLRGTNSWSTFKNTVICTAAVSAMYVPCVSHKERLPSRLSDAVERINEARGLLRERQARMQGVLRQYGGDIARHRGKLRWFVLDPVAPLLVAHSLHSHKARTLINLAKATSAAQIDNHKLEIRFRNEETLAFQVQSTLELATWLRALRGCIGNDQNPRPKWIDAVIYETENGAIST